MQHPNSLKIIFNGKGFVCNDLQLECRVPSQARPKVEEFVHDLNKLTKGTCLSFPYYVYIFLFIYLGSFIAIMITRKFYLLFIPIGFFILFFVGTIWFSISISRFIMNINKTVDKYRIELSPYYTVTNHISMQQRRYNYSYTEQAIILIPANQNNGFMPGPMYMNQYQNSQAQGFNAYGVYNPNNPQEQFYPPNYYNQAQYQQINGLQPGMQNAPIYTPPQNIPVYNYNPQNLQDNTINDYEDHPLGEKGNIK